MKCLRVYRDECIIDQSRKRIELPFRPNTPLVFGHEERVREPRTRFSQIHSGIYIDECIIDQSRKRIELPFRDLQLETTARYRLTNNPIIPQFWSLCLVGTSSLCD